jgi:hypothetical protein
MDDLIAAFNSRWYALENVSIVLQCSNHGKGGGDSEQDLPSERCQASAEVGNGGDVVNVWC